MNPAGIRTIASQAIHWFESESRTSIVDPGSVFRLRFQFHTPVQAVPPAAALLAEAFERAPDGAVHVINRYRDPGQNLRTQFRRIIERAGLKPWPKLFHNLRSTRETELTETYPMHVVCAWIGNSQPVASKHYLQVTCEHFERAVERPESTLQNPVQQALECTGNAPQTVNIAGRQNAETAVICVAMQ